MDHYYRTYDLNDVRGRGRGRGFGRNHGLYHGPQGHSVNFPPLSLPRLPPLPPPSLSLPPLPVPPMPPMAPPNFHQGQPHHFSFGFDTGFGMSPFDSAADTHAVNNTEATDGEDTVYDHNSPLHARFAGLNLREENPGTDSANLDEHAWYDRGTPMPPPPLPFARHTRFHPRPRPAHGPGPHHDAHHDVFRGDDDNEQVPGHGHAQAHAFGGYTPYGLDSYGLASFSGGDTPLPHLGRRQPMHDVTNDVNEDDHGRGDHNINNTEQTEPGASSGSGASHLPHAGRHHCHCQGPYPPYRHRHAHARELGRRLCVGRNRSGPPPLLSRRTIHGRRGLGVGRAGFRGNQSNWRPLPRSPMTQGSIPFVCLISGEVKAEEEENEEEGGIFEEINEVEEVEEVGTRVETQGQGQANDDQDLDKDRNGDARSIRSPTLDLSSHSFSIPKSPTHSSRSLSPTISDASSLTSSDGLSYVTFEDENASFDMVEVEGDTGTADVVEEGQVRPPMTSPSEARIGSPRVNSDNNDNGDEDDAIIASNSNTESRRILSFLHPRGPRDNTEDHHGRRHHFHHTRGFGLGRGPMHNRGRGRGGFGHLHMHPPPFPPPGGIDSSFPFAFGEAPPPPPGFAFSAVFGHGSRGFPSRGRGSGRGGRGGMYASGHRSYFRGM
ncbi:hypothetical protein VKT23_006125 [Stygiomarasmius scandens]|uniref:Uncharacterized protein n=1 Tax=Marasmiellus scandens TaxID=2682957 RepID=A0ABR1JQ84_9AGAR